MKFLKHSLLLFCFLFISQTIGAQWFHDDMGTTNSGTAPSPWVNTTAACNPPGITNLGVTTVGQVGTPTWFGGWDGVSTGTTASGACVTWQSAVGANGNSSVTYTYTLTVTGTATISSLTFGMRRNTVGNPNVAVSINGTSYTASPNTMPNTSWTPVSVTVSPARNYTPGQTISIVITFTGQNAATSGGTVQRLDELKIFGSTAAPAEMTEFTVKPAPVGFDLEWRTATEKDNHYFAVERSSDGQSYTEIARVDGAGNSTITQSYQYNDPNPLKGANYYRLKQVDFDGQSDYSPVRVVEHKTNHWVRISPNPLSQSQSPQLQLDMETEGTLQVNLYDQLGQLLHSAQIDVVKGNNVLTLDAATELPVGTYSVQVIDGKEAISTQQLIIR